MRNVKYEEIYTEISKRLGGMQFLESQNFDSRSNIDWYGERAMIVLHHTAFSTIQETKQAFDKYGVSAHFAIDKSGAVYAVVPVEERAWHAGHSQWRDSSQHDLLSVNCHSIGIEIVNTGYEQYTEWQMSSLLVLLQILEEKCGINKQSIVGHSDVAVGRKFDPNGYYFDWSYLYRNGGFGLYTQKLIDIKDNENNRENIIFEHFIGLGINSEKLNTLLNVKGITGILVTEASNSNAVLCIKMALKAIGYGYLDIESTTFSKALRIELCSKSEKVKEFQVKSIIKFIKELINNAALEDDNDLSQMLYSGKVLDTVLGSMVKYNDFGVLKAFLLHYQKECGFSFDDSAALDSVDGVNLQTYYVISALLEGVCGKQEATKNAQKFFDSFSYDEGSKELMCNVLSNDPLTDNEH